MIGVAGAAIGGTCGWWLADLLGKYPVIKALKLEEIYYPNDSFPMYLDKKSETLRIIQQMRDEAHRFGITHHRKRREKTAMSPQLTEIPGVGTTYNMKLLRKFKSVKNIRLASLQELQEVLGKSKGQLVYDFFQKKEN